MTAVNLLISFIIRYKANVTERLFGIFNRAVLKYVDAHRQKLRQRFPDRQSYATFSIPEELTESLK
ncbi:hypothetical protein, partial [Porphyromonas gingivalis]|uniref:hypothetical protein n=1 Tax=Porphyromonas gingivalis TaxID=837 RepID=UPI00117D6063